MAKQKTTDQKLRCVCCGKEKSTTNFMRNDSGFYRENYDYVPICKGCLEQFYAEYIERYKRDFEAEGIDVSKDDWYVEKQAVKRICMITNIYYSDKIFETASKKCDKQDIFKSYIRTVNLAQYKKKNYDNTIYDELTNSVRGKVIVSENDSEDTVITKDIINFFGLGFSDEDYLFLKNEYDDWTSRHECKTKAQEEIIKDICFNRLQNLKALRHGLDTKDITASFQKLLDAGKLQPKQNASDTLSEAQTFGTLIDKWENTRPVPEIAEEFKDVDKIGLYLDVFFRGHLAKMMNIKNGLSNLYSKYMEKYTAHKPEYDSEESSEAIFDAIFGKQMDD